MRKLWIVLLLSVSLFACHKDIQQVSVTLNIDQSQQGYSIPSNFEGLSFETSALINSPDYLNENNKVFKQLIENLGPGILRIGGNTSDRIGWANASRTADMSTNVLSTSEIDRLAAFSRTTGWPVIFGLNLGNKNADTAANEALYVYNTLGNNLNTIQFGNEPDFFPLQGLRPSGYLVYNYINDWNSYYSAVKSKIPNAPYAGPDIGSAISWLTIFGGNNHAKIKLMDVHYYVAGPGSSPSINYRNILNTDYPLRDYLNKAKSASATYNLPYRVSECNNIFGGGKEGVSNVFASSLWALDFMWTVAENGGQGVNFHGGPVGAYSPVLMTDGVIKPQPEYYAMLAFKYGNKNGKIVPVDFSDNHVQYNFGAHACANSDSTLSVTLVNREVQKDMMVTIKLTKATSNIEVLRLGALSIFSTTGITFAGSSINTDGTFKPANIEKYTVNADNFLIKLPAGSAAVVIVH